MQQWLERIAAWSGLSAQTIAALAASLGVVLVAIVIRWILLRVVRRRIADITRAYHWRRAITYAVTFMALLFVVRIWFTGFGGLGTFLGLVSAGLAIALGDLLKDLAGWLFILTRRPFQVGDRIQMGGHLGDVIDVRLFQTIMLECGNWVDADQSTGRMILIPNGKIFTDALANSTRGFDYIWDEVPVLVTFESDWKRAKQLLAEVAHEHAETPSVGAQEQIRRAARRHMMFFHNLTPTVYTAVKDSGVLLTLRYLVPPRRRRGVQQAIWEAILDRFAAEDGIDFAYPTVRTYLNLVEGKDGARAELPHLPR